MISSILIATRCCRHSGLPVSCEYESDLSAAFWQTLHISSYDVMVLPIAPRGKPRLSISDSWHTDRPHVARWLQFKDEVKMHANFSSLLLPSRPYLLHWLTYLPMYESWKPEKKAEKLYTIHDQKPDRDNIDKALMDILFKEDKTIGTGTIEKRWCLPGEERIELYAE